MKGSVLKVRFVIKFSKESSVKFISHLDLMRTIQRVIRRADLPIEYSKGFNPHMSLSMAQPLSVGMYSQGEYMDIVLTEDMEAKTVVEKLNAKCPSGIKIIDAVGLVIEDNVKKTPQAMALVEAAHYEIRIKYTNASELVKEIEALLSKEEWVTVKKSKSGEKTIDIKPMIRDFKYSLDDSYLVIQTRISCGSKENLSPELLSNYIKDNTQGSHKDAFVDIKRNELYTIKDMKLIPIIQFFK
jgi:radical SAM-linked protein